MTHWNLHTKSHPDADGRYMSDEDIIEVFCGNKKTANQVINTIKHEIIHEAIEAVLQYEKPTTEEQDHFIIDELEGSGDL